MRSEVRQQYVRCKPFGRSYLTHHGLMTCPAIICRSSDDAGPHGVEHNVTRDLQQIRLLLNECGFETALKQMADARMTAIESSRVFAEKPLHAARKCFNGQFDD